MVLAALALVAAWLPADAADPIGENKALLAVRVPANAAVTISDNPTRQTGPERVYVTPPLAPGRDYYYEVKATWNEGGQTKTDVRKVIVRAGQRSELDFTQAAAAAAALAKPEPATPAVNKDAKAKSRTFLFTYSATVTDLPADKKARVWLPVASSNDNQEVEIVDTKGLPEGYKIDKEPSYGNQVLYAEVTAAKPDLAITYRVTRREVKGPSAPEVSDAPKIARYLEPDALVPITGKPLELLKNKPLPMDQIAKAKVLYDVVNHHMKYNK